MAKRDSLLFKFFQNWKDKKLNKVAKNLLKKDPKIEKNLKALSNSFKELEKELDNR